MAEEYEDEEMSEDNRGEDLEDEELSEDDSDIMEGDSEEE